MTSNNGMNYSNILVSVVMPCFNDEEYIKDSINSVLGQTHTNLELLIVDDASSDKSVEIINEYKDPRIKLFLNDENQGAAYSRNVALRAAKGEYIAFLDADDIWLPNKIEKQLNFMIQNSYHFTYTMYSVMDEKGKDTDIYVFGPKKITHRKFLHANYVGCLTVMYKKNIYPDLQIPFDILKRNDYALWLKLSEREPCFLLKEILARYRRRTSNSISSVSRHDLTIKHKELFMKLYGYGKIRSTIRAYTNAFYHLLKNIKFKKKG